MGDRNGERGKTVSFSSQNRYLFNRLSCVSRQQTDTIGTNKAGVCVRENDRRLKLRTGKTVLFSECSLAGAGFKQSMISKQKQTKYLTYPLPYHSYIYL